jgi:AraC-like DNA-binding protein
MGRARVTRHESPIGRWEMAFALPPEPLRSFVREYVGWFEEMAVPICRRELPTEIIPLIINFGSPIRLFELGDPSKWHDVGSFTTGAYDTYQLVGSAGPSGGVQINLTLLGARLFFGRPLGDMKNRAVELEALLGRSARLLADELHDAPDWDARFSIVDRAVASRVLAARAVPSGVLCAWHRLDASRGRTSIGRIVDEVGWSSKHLIARFREEIGLTPKVLARILRFGHAVHLIQRGRATRLIDVALDSGYYDQAHFTRDAREFAGVTPGELVASLLPDGAGFLVADAEEPGPASAPDAVSAAASRG